MGVVTDVACLTLIFLRDLDPVLIKQTPNIFKSYIQTINKLTITDKIKRKTIDYNGNCLLMTKHASRVHRAATKVQPFIRRDGHFGVLVVEQ